MPHDRAALFLHEFRHFLHSLVPRCWAAVAASVLTIGVSCTRPKAPPDASPANSRWTATAPFPPNLGANGDDDAAARAAWTLEVDDGGTARISYRGSKVMTFH